MRKLLALAACGVLALGAAACGDDDSSSDSGGGGGGDLSGTIRIDGSSTVAPFAQAAQEAFQGENPGVKITVGTSAGAADLWDSGPVASTRQLDIAYGGAALAANRTYHWRVRVWDGSHADTNADPAAEVYRATP